MQAVKDELHQAADSVNKAGKAAYDKIVDPGVRGHLRDATRHLLKAAIAALDHAEKRCAEKGSAPAATPSAPVTPIETPPVAPQG